MQNETLVKSTQDFLRLYIFQGIFPSLPGHFNKSQIMEICVIRDSIFQVQSAPLGGNKRLVTVLNETN